MKWANFFFQHQPEKIRKKFVNIIFLHKKTFFIFGKVDKNLFLTGVVNFLKAEMSRGPA